MYSNIPIMLPLQLISIFYFVSLLHLPATSAALVAKPGCQDTCGNLSIPYPFGVGSNCSLDQYFSISCNTSTDPPKAYLSIINKEVIEINRTYIRVKYPNLVSVCYDLSDRERGKATSITTESYNDSMSVELSGTPYMLSRRNWIIAIGCDDMVLQSNGSWTSGGCSAFCADRNDTGGFGYCPNNASSLGNGCCKSQIHGATGIIGAQLIDLSGQLGRSKLFRCSYAFIHEKSISDETLFSYPLYYLDNSTAMQNDNWASATSPPVVQLNWIIEAENCSQAKMKASTYTCLDEKSVCVDYSDFYPLQFASDEPRGYFCRCLQGYQGNPYLPGGCQPISFTSSIAKPGCPDHCGKLMIPYPFGIGPNCYLAPSFNISCNSSTNPPKAYLAVLNAEIFQIINSSQVLVNNPYQMGLACYNLSDQNGITKTENRSLIIDLSRTQYTLSDENRITAIGCDDLVAGIVGKANQSFIGSSCASVCWDRQIDTYNYGTCPYGGDNYYEPGDGCCKAPIPRGTTYLEANLSDLSGQRQHRKLYSCSYVFVNYMDESGMEFLLHDLDNSTALQSWLGRDWLMLDWRIGLENCTEARQNLANFACRNNTHCIDYDTEVGGYLCNCSEGYQGNPYLTPGCQDIDECADNTTSTCDSRSTCVNTLGSFNCVCPKGYYGDGRKDGRGCMQLAPSKSKMIILIGMGSGLGFLLLLLMCFWLYKVLQKRKEKNLKEKFFKRNGGLLLRQQTNEGTLGKTKVFPAKELEVATDHFNVNRILGHGGQGTVYKGMLSDGKIVAIKKSKLVEENQLQQFINEVAILSQINHRNVVKLLGCCLETEVPLLVYEFMPNGTLFELIHDPNNEFPFPWNMRLKIAADIAGALAYLHSASSMPIYHRDIKSSNLLLDEKYVVKVSDFGTSRSISADQTHLTTMVKGTFGYLDPEYFQSSQFTEKSDVYSFGVVLVELLTGERPISLEKTDNDRSLATRFLTCMEENCLDTILDPQVSEQGRMEEVIVVARLAQRCLNLKGRMRPTMKEVATELESVRISQMSAGVKDESEDVRGFEDMPTSISDIEYTWTGSYKSAGASSSDTYPLIQ